MILPFLNNKSEDLGFNNLSIAPGNCSGSYSTSSTSMAIAYKSNSTPNAADATMFSILNLGCAIPPFFFFCTYGLSMLMALNIALPTSFSFLPPVQMILPFLNNNNDAFGPLNLSIAPGNCSGSYSTSSTSIAIAYKSNSTSNAADATIFSILNSGCGIFLLTIMFTFLNTI